MDIALITLFLLLGIAFFILEIFFLPGISVGGIAGLSFTVVGVWYSFVKLGTVAGWITVAIAALVFIIAIWAFLKAKVLERMSLTTDLADSDSPRTDVQLNIGDTGHAISRLAPMGKALFGTEQVEVKAQDTLIAPGSTILIVEIKDNLPIVVKI